MLNLRHALVSITATAVLLTSTAYAAEQAEKGMDCNVTHEAKTHKCRTISGNPETGPKGVIVKDGAFKTCGESDNPDDTCTEKPKATHTIELYSDTDCTKLERKLVVDENRCD